MTVLKLTEGLELNEAGIKVFEDIDSNEQWAAPTKMGVMRMFACYGILKKKGGLCLTRFLI
jgi:hypothetical protein